MGNYTIFLKFENPRRGRQARNLSENDPKILDLKSSSEQIICRKLSLGAPVLMTRQYPDLGSDGSSVWNFIACFSDDKNNVVLIRCQSFMN